MGTKTAVFVANIFMAYIETTTVSKTVGNATQTTFFPMGHIKVNQTSIEAFIEQANLHHPTITFTAETSDTETVFLDTVVYKGTRFKEKFSP